MSNVILEIGPIVRSENQTPSPMPGFKFYHEFRGVFYENAEDMRKAPGYAEAMADTIQRWTDFLNNMKSKYGSDK